MSVPLVSVLLTSYNRERYIATSIGSADIARSYERLDTRVRVVVNERNLGQFGNRNHAAELARAPLLKYHDSDDLMYRHCLEVMVSMLMSEPRAGFGLSCGWCWPGGPCPMLLTPRMAYQREFLGGGLFMCGPSGAIFRTGVFRELGGFVDHGAPSDHLFWLRACARINVLLLPADLFWYRQHPSQEFQSARAQREYALVFGSSWQSLDARDCPLTPEEREQAKRNRVYHLAKRTAQDLRRARWTTVHTRLRTSGLSLRDWLTYLRPPRRDALAGTPVDANGEYVIPQSSVQ